MAKKKLRVAKKKKTTRKKATKSTSRNGVKVPPVLFDRTQQIVREIADRCEGTFLTYWTSANGSICSNDVQAMYEAAEHVNLSGQVTLFVKSDGGDGQSSLRIIHLLRERVERLTVVLPLECASAATMLALGADEIQMGPLAFLTPVDTSLEHAMGPVDSRNEIAYVGHDELQRVVGLWKKQGGDGSVNPYQELYKYLHPLVIGAVDRATSLSIRLCTEILQYHIDDPDQAKRIAHSLNSDYPAHEYPITRCDAERLGLNVTPLDRQLNAKLLELNSLYSEMGQRAVTDFDEFNYHDNEIVNILEGPGIQLFFQNDKDWHYRKEERQWTSLHVESCWHRLVLEGKKIKRSKIYIR